MTIKYLFLDDEGEETIRSYVRAVSRAGGGQLEIEYENPREYGSQIDYLRERCNGDVDGLILDLRLDMRANEVEGGKTERAKYRGTTLAQEVRTLSGEGKINDVPLVLWSMNNRLRKSFRPDATGHDLFDVAAAKDELESPAGARVMAKKLVSLAMGYKQLREILDENRKRKRWTYKLVGLEEQENVLDPRILSYFDNESALALHEYARFLLELMLRKPGPLIGEKILAARLGIDINQSEGWADIRSMLDQVAAYMGPFSEGWSRWWWPTVSAWWEDAVGKSALEKVPAKDRVEVLKEVTDRNDLVSAEPISEEYSSYYWTICKVYKKPLDPVDGVRVRDDGHEPWMDREYISKHAAVRGRHKNAGIRIDSLDQSRITRLKGKKSN